MTKNSFLLNIYNIEIITQMAFLLDIGNTDLEGNVTTDETRH